MNSCLGSKINKNKIIQQNENKENLNILNKKEEINTNMNIDEEIKKNGDKELKFKLNDEKEICKIELAGNIVVRLLENNGQKFVDFAKFYKGYPTKKSIKIDYNTYIEMNKLFENN